jgi:hypothetical protein
LQDLQSAIYRNMRPYNPSLFTHSAFARLFLSSPYIGLILHVGIEGYVPSPDDSLPSAIFNPTKKETKVVTAAPNLYLSVSVSPSVSVSVSLPLSLSMFLSSHSPSLSLSLSLILS